MCCWTSAELWDVEMSEKLDVGGGTTAKDVTTRSIKSEIEVKVALTQLLETALSRLAKPHYVRRASIPDPALPALP